MNRHCPAVYASCHSMRPYKPSKPIFQPAYLEAELTFLPYRSRIDIADLLGSLRFLADNLAKSNFFICNAFSSYEL